jgi:hypothetical protein
MLDAGQDLLAYRADDDYTCILDRLREGRYKPHLFRFQSGCAISAA